ALLAAARREHRAQELYRELACLAQDPAIREALAFLAEQERSHASILVEEFDHLQP
ncbi:MAG: hypothetical protein HQM00_16860, partial [Magnetococcales bacterium]|nr:hypothetical protein [Magnetococcales bacterium]